MLQGVGIHRRLSFRQPNSRAKTADHQKIVRTPVHSSRSTQDKGNENVRFGAEIDAEILRENPDNRVRSFVELDRATDRSPRCAIVLLPEAITQQQDPASRPFVRISKSPARYWLHTIGGQHIGA